MVGRLRPLLASLVVAAVMVATTSCATGEPPITTEGPLRSSSKTNLATCSTSFGRTAQEFLASGAFTNSSTAPVRVTDVELTDVAHLSQLQTLYLGAKFTSDLATVPIASDDDQVLYETWKNRSTFAPRSVDPGEVMQVGVVVKLARPARTGHAGPLEVHYSAGSKQYRVVGTFHYTMTANECMD